MRIATQEKKTCTLNLVCKKHRRIAPLAPTATVTVTLDTTPASMQIECPAQILESAHTVALSICDGGKANQRPRSPL